LAPSNKNAVKITNIPLLRKSNVLALFGAIWEKKVTTRKELAELTSLTAPPISGIISQFLKQGLVRVRGKGTSAGGRQPELIEFIPDAFYVIGVSVGVYRHRAAIFDLYGDKVREVSIEAHHTRETGQLTRHLYKILDKLVSGFSDPKKLIGIGVSFPGSVNNETGVVLNSPIIGNAIGLNIKASLETRFGIPLFTENNANLCALGEYWFGKGRGKKFVLFIYAGYGIGGGLVIGGEIYIGSRDAAGEIGHTVMAVNGKKCYCGSRGCLETIAALPALCEQYRRKKGVTAGKGSDRFHISEVRAIFSSALGGDLQAAATIRSFGTYLGIATANLLNILNPDIVVFGGEYSEVEEIITDPIKEAVQARAWPVVKGTEIVFTDFGMEAEMRGGATLVIKKLLETGYAFFGQ
jgi:predicted NBD/HSP70 family sugar kinase